MNEREVIAEQLLRQIEVLTEELEGTFQNLTTFDSTGRQSKKIVIEYDVKEKDAT